MNNRIKFYIGILLALTNFIFFSCSDNYPKSKEEPYATDLLSIKIINAGAEGNTIVDGTIDEENKMVSFPRLDTLTDFSAINVDAKVSEGAKITQSVFDFSMSEEESFKTLILLKSVKTSLFLVQILKNR